jgi:prepilin-type N-terminal cleavage/methylation domain-containing protein
MNHPLPRSSGFTLLEMMIAIGLGALIIFTATAGFRVASQSVTTANRLSLENGMLRAGFLRALDEVDYWTAYDDPTSAVAKDRRLRPDGLPFGKMLTGTLAQTPAPATFPAPKNQTGWDPSFTWSVADPRTWWRGNMGEWNDSDQRMGPYLRFADASDPTNTNAWLYAQFRDLIASLGYQGMCEYLPPNMIYAYYDSTSTDVNTGPGKLVRKYVTEGSSFKCGDGGANHPEGRYRTTKNNNFCLVPTSTLGEAMVAGYTVNQSGAIRQNYHTGVNVTPGEMQNFVNLTTSYARVIEHKPAVWPDVTLRTSRYLCYNRFVCLTRVGWASPLTGDQIELSFTAFGTTLRGARLQRKPGSDPNTANGWARWRNTWDGSGTSPNDPTLDGPQ